MRQIFCDMDGVLADFDRGYDSMISSMNGETIDTVRQKGCDVNWHLIKDTQDFFLRLPPTPDMQELWSYIKDMNPIVLTGVPKEMPELATANKRAWLDKHLGTDVRMIACRAKDKCLHGRPRDILIDDWEKHKKKWVDMGGYWITHVSAEKTTQRLFTLLNQL